MLQIGRGKAKLDCLSRDIFDRTWYVLAVGNIDHQRQINRALDCALCMPRLPKQVGWIKDVLKLLASVFFFRPRDWHPEDLKFSGGACSLTDRRDVLHPILVVGLHVVLRGVATRAGEWRRCTQEVLPSTEYACCSRWTEVNRGWNLQNGEM